jgi:hypothetical protein
MPSILIQLDEQLLRSLNKVAPAAKRQRAEFIRQAVKDAIRKREYEPFAKHIFVSPIRRMMPMTGLTRTSGRHETVGNLVGRLA